MLFDLGLQPIKSPSQKFFWGSCCGLHDDATVLAPIQCQSLMVLKLPIVQQ